MVYTLDSLKKILLDKEIHPTHQRLMVYDYLNKNHSHPTVDQIYSSLHKSIPTLSKMTVYNVLKVLVKGGLANEIHTIYGESHYDLVEEPHAHFHCTRCHQIYDLSIKNNIIDHQLISNFKVSSQTVYLTGLCPDCNKI